MQKPHVVFAAKPYGIDNILKETRGAPVITVEAGDLSFDDKLVIVNGDDSKNEIVLYKYEGKYVVLLGWDAARVQLDKNSKVTGKLLSKQMLKHVSIVDVPVNVHNQQAQAVEQEVWHSRQEQIRERFGDRYQSGHRDRNSDGMGRLSERMQGQTNLRREEGQGFEPRKPFSPHRKPSESKGHSNEPGNRSFKQP